MDQFKFDWRAVVAIAFVTFLILNGASLSGVDTAPIWALLAGFAAAAGFVAWQKRESRS
jgi:hypothetical protein